MSMKKSDLDKQLAMKLDGRMKGAGIPGRFAQGAGAVVDRREQRRLDAAAGLVPFACKLPGDLAATLRERGAAHEGGLNGAVAELLQRALAASPAATADRGKGEPTGKAEKARAAEKGGKGAKGDTGTTP